MERNRRCTDADAAVGTAEAVRCVVGAAATFAVAAMERPEPKPERTARFDRVVPTVGCGNRPVRFAPNPRSGQGWVTAAVSGSVGSIESTEPVARIGAAAKVAPTAAVGRAHPDRSEARSTPKWCRDGGAEEQRSIDPAFAAYAAAVNRAVRRRAAAVARPEHHP